MLVFDLFVLISRRKVKKPSIHLFTFKRALFARNANALYNNKFANKKNRPSDYSKSPLPHTPLLSSLPLLTSNRTPQTCTLLPLRPLASSTPNPKTSLYKSRIHTHCSFLPNHFTLFAASLAPSLFTGSVCAAPMLLSFTTNFW
jgi:hypothetical protein